jgi:hypothetical protein
MFLNPEKKTITNSDQLVSLIGSDTRSRSQKVAWNGTPTILRLGLRCLFFLGNEDYKSCGYGIGIANPDQLEPTVAWNGN